MYFQHYRLSKTWLKNSLESVVSEPPLTVNMLMGGKHFEIRMIALLSHFWVTLKGNDLENISLIGI